MKDARDAAAPPEVSVIIPSRGAPACLLDALRSALIQGGLRLEVIVVLDGCSSERETELRKALDGSMSVAFLRHDGHCASTSRNLGLKQARGDWVAFLDHDDVMLPGRLQRMVSVAREQSKLWVISDAERVDVVAGERAYEEALPVNLQSLLGRNTVPGGGSGPVIRRATVLAAGGFDEALRNAEDWDLWIRLCQQGEPAVLSECTIIRRVNPGSKAGALRPSIEALVRIERKHRRLRRVHRAHLNVGGYLGWIVRHQRRRRRPSDASYWRADNS
jgi:glycosyltransferase involved in cell wall biosynthesis